MQDFENSVVWIPIYNSTNETIPGGALMEPFANFPIHNGQDQAGNTIVRRPTKSSDPRVIVNGATAIAPGKTGFGHRDSMATIAYDTLEALPISGDSYGSKRGSWIAARGQTGFLIDYAGGGRAVAMRDFIEMLYPVYGPSEPVQNQSGNPNPPSGSGNSGSGNNDENYNSGSGNNFSCEMQSINICYLADISVQCVTQSGGGSSIRVTKVFKNANIAGCNLSIVTTDCNGPANGGI
jgi:hypothetical protein